MRELESVTVEGFRSIKAQTLRLQRLNLVIGGNGVGKSNLVSAFRFLHDIYFERLQEISAATNVANLFYRGPKATNAIRLKLRFIEQLKRVANEYDVQLGFGEAGLFVSGEIAGFQDFANYPQPYTTGLVIGGAKEAGIRQSTNSVARYVAEDISSYRVYHFHDTSRTANVKQPGKIDNNRVLEPDAANLAAILYLLKKTHPDHYRLIETSIKQVAPFFDGFILEPLRANVDLIKLEWRERGSDAYFDAHALSDGTLRFMCLAILLLQPDLPRLVLIDEPELGLHPASIVLLADLLRQAAVKSQILLATQSVTLINQFEPENIVVAERVDGASVFRRLEGAQYQSWLEEYALGEMWEKNLIGGRP
jgi:predicted ATPase